MEVKEAQEIINKATEAMVKSLNSYGPGETLKLLLTYSNQDPILRELLAIFPSIVALNYFLRGKPIIKIRMTDRAVERLLDTKCPFLIREDEPEKDRTVRKKAPRRSKKTRCRKHKTRSRNNHVQRQPSLFGRHT